MTLSTVLIIDDEPKVQGVVRQALSERGVLLLVASTGRAGILMAEAKRPDLIILDLGLPDMDGADICTAIRSWSSVPILVLSARVDEQEKARLFEAGADDYVTKPFSTIELRARVQAQMRRARMAPIAGTEAPIVIGDLQIDTARRQVARSGKAIHLTPTEWGIAACSHCTRR